MRNSRRLFRGRLICNALHHCGQLVVLDAKGEVYAAMAERRRELGQELRSSTRKLVALQDALARLQETNFRVSPRLLKIVREGIKHD